MLSPCAAGEHHSGLEMTAPVQACLGRYQHTVLPGIGRAHFQTGEHHPVLLGSASVQSTHKSSQLELEAKIIHPVGFL